MKPFAHHHARSINEVITLMKKYKGKAKLNAGGTDLINVLKEKSLPDYPQAIIDIKTIGGLDYIQTDETGLRIGALAKLSDVANSPAISEKYKLLSEAARSVATPQVRNMCTIGGNLAQDVRCWYYRYPEQIGGPIVCLRKGGKICNALTGDNRYHSIFGVSGMAVYPCSTRCPANTDIPSALSRVRNGDLKEAAKILLDFNPIPAITGRVCPVFCESECNRSEFDEPVGVRSIERFIGDYMLEKRTEIFKSPKTESGKSIAVVGSGPAGLAAAYYLRRSGHSVTVFEKLKEAGGMLFYSIPQYRLPKDVVRKQVQALKGMGIKFELGVHVGKDRSFSKLMGQFNALFLAGGAWRERSLGMKGEKLFLSGLEFLQSVNAGNRKNPGKRVAVIGGGNVAIDVARTLLRLSADPVVIYRRTQNEMPAFEDEVEKARQEGIKFEFLTLPIEAQKTDNQITLKCVRMELGPPDASGRPQPVVIQGSDFTTTFDAVIKAIGEQPDTSLLPAGFRRKAPKKGTSVQFLGKKLFVGGDFLNGPSTVIQAVASGREAANLIEASVKGGRPSVKKDWVEPDFRGPSLERIDRVQVPELSVSERVKSIEAEDTRGLSLSEIEKEASRCFNCGCLAVSPSDIGTALVALDADIVTTKRTLSAQSFFTASATGSTVLDPDELITEIQIAEPPEGARQNYLKFTLRKPVDFAIVSVASIITMKDGVCTDARISLGAVAPEPVRAKKAEEIIKGRSIDRNVAEEAAEQAVSGAKPLSMNAYKIEITKALVKRAILDTDASLTVA
jgi:NADPH-dependent glutamate synthase beta subunit-like oxidoreductase/CO/xanthine dehydrogenase FAD-binding subunit